MAAEGNSLKGDPFEITPMDKKPVNPDTLPASTLSLDFDEAGNLVEPTAATVQHQLKFADSKSNISVNHSESITARNQKADAQLANKQTPSAERQEQLQQRFERAAKVGRDFLVESSQRESKMLAPYLNQRRFNPEDVKKLRNPEQFSVEDVTKVERASFALAMQAANQIANVRLPKMRPEQALKRSNLEGEIEKA